MNKFLLVLFFSFLISAELDVDGNLNVSGSIQSPTIESLLEQISQLQNQILILQNQINSNPIKHKIVTIENNDLLSSYTLSYFFPNEDIDWAIVYIVDCNSQAGNYCSLRNDYTIADTSVGHNNQFPKTNYFFGYEEFFINSEEPFQIEGDPQSISLFFTYKENLND